ncbi:MAG TPA: hypothetical protein DF613_11895 [Lachnospiraceae bacterium]|nr:hypothetical protein [Lachnospiraceae bacterium]
MCLQDCPSGQKGIWDNSSRITCMDGNRKQADMDVKKLTAVLAELLEDQEGVAVEYQIEEPDGWHPDSGGKACESSVNSVEG